MNIEKSIKDVIQQKLENGTVEKLVAENLEKGINEALGSLFRSYGDVTKIIESKIKEVLVQQIEHYDFSDYVVKLDYVLTEILKNTALDNKKILENFKSFMTDVEIPKKLKVSDLFEQYCNYVSKNVSTYGLEVNTDDDPCYENVDICCEVTELDKPTWSSYKEAKIYFTCDHDEDMNIEIPIKKWKDGPWRLDITTKCDISSLRRMNDFTIYLLKVNQNYAEIEIDTWHDEYSVEPEEKPEVSFN